MKIRPGDTALITGASRGIGRHIALALGRRRVNLVLAARNQDGLDTVADEVRAATGVTVSTVTVDLGDRDQAAELLARAEAAAGSIDILVNNAGLEGAYRPNEVPTAQLGAMTDVNLLAPMVLTRMALPGMITRGRGHIVNVSSVAGLLAAAYQEPYTATKFGLVGFTRSLRLTAQDRQWGFSASVLCPGFLSGEGMYANMQTEFGVTAPKVAAAMPVELVGPAVIRAIEEDLPEVTITRGSPRAMVIASTIAPRLFERIIRGIDLAAPFRTVAERRKAPDAPSS